MKLLIVRHGDPDYTIDSLTPKGWKEVDYLSEKLAKLDVKAFYVSPLGRAQKTAEYSLKRLGRAAQTLEWLREFPARIDLEQAAELREAYPGAEKQDGSYVPRIVWDVAPSYWSVHSDCMDSARWKESEICANSDTVKIYDRVVEEFDRFLEEKGYVRDGLCYRVEKENAETVTFFCHFGITCALLAHLWNFSPFSLWQDLALAPTSVTEIVTEERQQGIAVFRGLKLGDVSHLNMGGEPVSLAARFCEVYSNMDQRH